MDHKKRLQIAINEIVRDKALKLTDAWHLTINDLESDTLDSLLFLIWESEDRPIEPLINEGDEIIKYIISCSLRYLNDESLSTDIVEYVCVRLFKYYRDKLISLIDDACVAEFIEARDYPNDQ